MIAREKSVEVQSVDRRGAAPSHHRRQIDGGYDDQSAGNRCRIEIANKLAESNRPFIFVAVIAALKNDGRSPAILDDGHRDRHDAPCIFMNRQGEVEEAYLLAFSIEIDVGAYRRYQLHKVSAECNEKASLAPGEALGPGESDPRLFRPTRIRGLAVIE